MHFTRFRCATFEIAVFSHDFRNCSLLLFAARLSKVQFTRCRNCSLLIFVARLLKLQFTRFRPPSPFQSTQIIQKRFPRTPQMFQQNKKWPVFWMWFEEVNFVTISVSSTPNAHFWRSKGLLLFAARVSKLQFTPFRSATFEVVVYSFSWCDLWYCNLLFSTSPISTMHSFCSPNPAQSIEIIQKCSPILPKWCQNAPQMRPKCAPKPPEIEKKSIRATEMSKVRKN